jgi:hypothetical protein
MSALGHFRQIGTLATLTGMSAWVYGFRCGGARYFKIRPVFAAA